MKSKKLASSSKSGGEQMSISQFLVKFEPGSTRKPLPTLRKPPRQCEPPPPGAEITMVNSDDEDIPMKAKSLKAETAPPAGTVRAPNTIERPSNESPGEMSATTSHKRKSSVGMTRPTKKFKIKHDSGKPTAEDPTGDDDFEEWVGSDSESPSPPARKRKACRSSRSKSMLGTASKRHRRSEESDTGDECEDSDAGPSARVTRSSGHLLASVGLAVDALLTVAATGNTASAEASPACSRGKRPISANGKAHASASRSQSRAKRGRPRTGQAKRKHAGIPSADDPHGDEDHSEYEDPSDRRQKSAIASLAKANHAHASPPVPGGPVVAMDGHPGHGKGEGDGSSASQPPATISTSTRCKSTRPPISPNVRSTLTSTTPAASTPGLRYTPERANAVAGSSKLPSTPEPASDESSPPSSPAQPQVSPSKGAKIWFLNPTPPPPSRAISPQKPSLFTPSKPKSTIALPLFPTLSTMTADSFSGYDDESKTKVVFQLQSFWQSIAEAEKKTGLLPNAVAYETNVESGGCHVEARYGCTCADCPSHRAQVKEEGEEAEREVQVKTESMEEVDELLRGGEQLGKTFETQTHSSTPVLGKGQDRAVAMLSPSGSQVSSPRRVSRAQRLQNTQ